MGSLKTALFLDIPSLIDSAWRRVEYSLNAECRYHPGPPPNQPDPPAKIDTRQFWTKPPFWLFAITVFFVSYGPTWGGLCAIAPRAITDGLRNTVAVVIIGGSLVLGGFLFLQACWLIQRRFERL
jgi:hypothetical protein